MYVWSAKANGFFPISEKEKFEASGLWPDDGVIVSEEEHKKLFTDIPPGKQIGTLNGKLDWPHESPDNQYHLNK